VRTPVERFSVLVGVLIALVGIGIFAAPSNGLAQNANLQRGASLRALVRGRNALASAALRSASGQDAAQTPAPAAAPSAPKPVELPEGDGKPIATEFCQDCHKLTNLVKAHKNLDDWKDTIRTMMDRGARIPDDKVDPLAEYLAKNFPEKDTAAAADPPVSAPAAPASPSQAAPSAPAAAKPVELPDGDGKDIATENCQACHKLTNLTKAHKSLDEWKDTVQTMIDRGANVPTDKVDVLVQYLAKNFGPKDASAPSSSAPSSSTQSQ